MESSQSSQLLRQTTYLAFAVDVGASSDPASAASGMGSTYYVDCHRLYTLPSDHLIRMSVDFEATVDVGSAATCLRSQSGPAPYVTPRLFSILWAENFQQSG